ncbi:hypothetical protein R3P38DRAFT_2762817 [Favolaschia claudopus]|uniref:Uncharacterized protein n=1 Tax=Favolaschia claudopus TaxID=2862362 RepID=A0AAW0DMM8_9AGAR
MLRLRFCLWFLAAPLLSGATQYPFNTESDDHDIFELKWPVNKVAIIGAGVSGLIAYRELSSAGFSRVRVFERDDVPGGNWHYTEEIPLDAPIPNADPSVGDFVPSLPPRGSEFPVVKYYSDGEAQWRAHRGPKPVWASLESNAPAITELPWPPGTPWHLPHRLLGRYLRAFASFHGVNSNDVNSDIAYNTRVELVEKRYDETGQERGWTLTLKRLERVESNRSKATWWTEDFDAIVVATGRYNAPNIPSIPGLQDWSKKFPESVSHSRQYRRPQPFEDKTVLVVGGATSGVEISREIDLHAKTIFQSVRPPNPNLPYEAGRLQLQRLPRNVSLVPEIRRFHPSNSSIELVNGTFLVGIERIIFATGFRYSFPFLPQFHNSSTPSEHPIVTDGSHLRSLHEDFLYIEEPTIGFLSMNWGMQSFTYSEYLSLALAKVWSGKALLPGRAELWRRYEERVRDRGGYGRHFQFLGAERTAANIRFFLGWLNDAAVKYGGKQAQYGVVFAELPNGTVSSLDWAPRLFYLKTPFDAIYCQKSSITITVFLTPQLGVLERLDRLRSLALSSDCYDSNGTINALYRANSARNRTFLFEVLVCLPLAFFCARRLVSLSLNMASMKTIESPSSDSDSQHTTVLREPPKRSWLGILWDTADVGAEERRMLFKVDASLLLFASLGYFIKNLDQFFAGMKEDLNMNGNELVHATSYWTAGYVIGQLPSNLLLTRISPQYVIPTLELAWGLATLGTYSVKNVEALYALRYTPRELAKRSTIFWASGSLGTMFSGFLQTAAYNNLDGVRGLAGWRWLMIVDAIVSKSEAFISTIPIALFGFVFLPDLPWSAKPSLLLSADEIALARARMKAVGRKEKEPWSKAKLRRILTGWHIYILPIEYVLWNNGSAQSPMQYWLKSFNVKPYPVPEIHYTVSQVQLLPLPATAIFFVTALTLAWVSDGPAKGLRWPFVIAGSITTLIFDTVWLSMPLYTHLRGHFAYFYLMTLGTTAGPLILNWISEITGADNELRAICVALGNDLAYVVQAVAPNFVWKTTDFPRATKGYHWSIILQFLLSETLSRDRRDLLTALSVTWTFLILYLLRRDKKKGSESAVSDTNQPTLEPTETSTVDSGTVAVPVLEHHHRKVDEIMV